MNLIFTDQASILKSKYQYRNIIASAINAIYTRKVISRIKKNTSTIICCDDGIKKILENKCNNKIITYDDNILKFSKKQNYIPIHKLADSLFDLSLSKDGREYLTTHGVPILELLEIRWIEKINHNLLKYIDVIFDLIENFQVNSIEIIGNSKLEKLAVASAKRKSINILRRNNPSFFASQISKEKNKRSYHSYALSKNFKTSMSYLSDNTKPPKTILGNDKKILFVGEIDRSLTTILPIIDLLKEKGIKPLVIAKNRVTCKKDFVKNDVLLSEVSDWITLSEAKEITKDSRLKAIKGWDKICDQQDEISSEMRGIIIFPFVKNIIASALIEGSEFATLTAEIAERCIKTWTPDLIVHFEESELNRAFMMIGKTRGIKSLSYYTISPNARSDLVRRKGDFLATGGTLLKELFSNQFPSSNIDVVGNSLYKKFSDDEKQKIKHDFCKKFNLSIHYPIVLMFSKTQVMSPWTTSDVEDHFEGTFSAISKIKNAQIIIKHHPLQDKSDIDFYLSKYGVKATVLSHYDLIELSLISDLVSVQPTSAAWYPMSVGTPVVSIQSRKLLTHYNYINYDYLKNKGVVCIEPGDDAYEVINDLLFDTDKRAVQVKKGYEHASEHFGVLDGKAPQRLSNFLVSLVKT